MAGVGAPGGVSHHCVRVEGSVTGQGIATRHALAAFARSAAPSPSSPLPPKNHCDASDCACDGRKLDHLSHDDANASAMAMPLVPSAKEGGDKKEQQQQDMSDLLKKAANRALGGGVAGAAAMAINVTTLMWIRTTVNFQYRYGMSTAQALRHLYRDGGSRPISGIARFYRGYFPALMQGPLARFGDTAANAGVMAFMESNESTKDLPVMVKTLGASIAAAGMRIFLMPIDAWKTTKQVEGAAGLQKLISKMRTSGPTVLWHGALGAASATFVGHYPWWSVYNYLNAYLPQYDRHTDFGSYLARNAAIGFAASAVSDSVSNPIRVLKTYRQTSTEKISYPAAARQIISQEGIAGFWTRGLPTKIVANGLQGVMFSVGFKYFSEIIFKKQDQREEQKKKQ